MDNNQNQNEVNVTPESMPEAGAPIPQVPVSDKEFRAWMIDIEKENSIQAKEAKKQTGLVRLTAICTVLLLLVIAAAGVLLVPRALKLMDETEVLVQDLQQVTEELTAADLPGAVNNLNQLAIESQAGVTQAMEKLNGVDMETLNQSIQDLQAVVGPLAKLFGR